jgi:hypothetical protein
MNQVTAAGLLDLSRCSIAVNLCILGQERKPSNAPTALLVMSILRLIPTCIKNQEHVDAESVKTQHGEGCMTDRTIRPYEGISADNFQSWVEAGWTRKSNTPVDDVRELAIMVFGLAGEVGEVIEPIKKELRGDGPLDRSQAQAGAGRRPALPGAHRGPVRHQHVVHHAGELRENRSTPR